MSLQLVAKFHMSFVCFRFSWNFTIVVSCLECVCRAQTLEVQGSRYLAHVSSGVVIGNLNRLCSFHKSELCLSAKFSLLQSELQLFSKRNSEQDAVKLVGMHFVFHHLSTLQLEIGLNKPVVEPIWLEIRRGRLSPLLLGDRCFHLHATFSRLHECAWLLRLGVWPPFDNFLSAPFTGW